MFQFIYKSYFNYFFSVFISRRCKGRASSSNMGAIIRAVLVSCGPDCGDYNWMMNIRGKETNKLASEIFLAINWLYFLVLVFRDGAGWLAGWLSSLPPPWVKKITFFTYSLHALFYSGEIVRLFFFLVNWQTRVLQLFYLVNFHREGTNAINPYHPCSICSIHCLWNNRKPNSIVKLWQP